MDALFGLFSLAGLSLFLSRFLKRPVSLMPLLAVAVSMLWFTLFGCLGLLLPAGWLWYALCAVALGYVVVKEKKELLKTLRSPGFLFFLGGGVFFVLLFWATKPMFTQWDDFTFWGTAAKAVFEQGEMYTIAQSNLLHRSYPPGLIMLTYMVQFFGGSFSEYKMLAAYSFVYLAAFSAASAFWEEKKTAALCFLGGLFALPLFFEAGTYWGEPSWAYFTVMADMPMAAMFGGALSFYFAGGQKNGRLLGAFGLVLAALTCMKDMGFALALFALFIAGMDVLFCERDRISFFKWKGWKAILALGGICLACIAGAYLVWTVHLAVSPLGVNRFDLGSAGQKLPMTEMLGMALSAVFGFSYHEQYAKVLPMMMQALTERPVSVIGSGMMVFAFIMAVLACAFVCAATKRHRRKVLVFAITSTVAFALFYLFHIILYAFIFKEVEALILKDYLRYISPFWQGWLMAAMVLLGISATTGRELRVRVQAARAASLVLAVCLVLAVSLRGNHESNFLYYSPSNYVERWDVKNVLAEAETEGMRPEHRIYLLSQGDDGTRSYQFRYEAGAEIATQYDGVLEDAEGRPIKEEGQLVYAENVGTSITDPAVAESPYRYAAPGGPEDLAAFLKQEECTHFLIDQLDNYFIDEFGSMFSDELRGWSDDDSLSVGCRYYRVVFEDGECLLVPEEGGAAA